MRLGSVRGTNNPFCRMPPQARGLGLRGGFLESFDAFVAFWSASRDHPAKRLPHGSELDVDSVGHTILCPIST